MLGIASPSCSVPKEKSLEIKEDRLKQIATRIEEITYYLDREIYYYDKYLDDELKRGIQLKL